MEPLVLHSLHAGQGAVFGSVGGREVVAHYGDAAGEYRALLGSVGVVDLSARSRLALVGADRQKMLNGQVTNNVKDLQPWEGCYAALVNARARMLSDMNIYALPDELVLDFEPGLTALVKERLEQFIIGEDVQVVDASASYGLLSLQGPRAGVVADALALFASIPTAPCSSVAAANKAMGELYLVRQSRAGTDGFDFFVPNDHLDAAWQRLNEACRAAGGGPSGWNALDVSRIEAGIPRFGIDMDDTNLPPEAGLSDGAISYTKGCYIGQEVIARIRTYGQVAKALRGLVFHGDPGSLPARRTPLFKGEKEVGYLTSATRSPRLEKTIGLGYVRRESNAPGTELKVGSPGSEVRVRIVPLPFSGNPGETG